MSRTDEVGVRARILGARKFLVDAKAMAHEVRDVGDAAEHSDRKIMGLNARVTLLRNSMRLVRPFALITGLGLAAQSASALAAGATAASAALAPLAGSMVAFPSLGLAAAQGMGVWTIAIGDLGKAVGGLNTVLDENSSAFTSLPPQGQALARTLDRMKRPLIDAQSAAQAGLFPGLEDGARSLMPLLSDLTDEIGGTGMVMGSIARQTGAMLSSGPWSRDLQDQLAANNRYIGAFGAMGLNLANVLRNLIVTGRPLTDWLVDTAEGWSQNLSLWSEAGRANGSLTKDFAETRKVMSLVFRLSGALAKSMFNIGRAAYPLGHELLGAVTANAEAFERWTGSASGQNKLRRYFADMRPSVYEIGRLLRDVTKAFFDLGNQPGNDKLIRQLRTQVLPALVDVTKHVTGGFGPALMDGVVSLSHLAQVLAGGIGPLTMWVRGLTALANAVVWLATVVPGAGQALVLLYTGWRVFSFASTVATVMRLSSALTAVRGSTMLLRAQLALLSLQESAVGVAAAGMWAAITGPVGLVVLGVAAVAAGAVLLYRKWGWFHHAVDNTFNFIKSHWPLLVAIIMPLAAPVVLLVRHFADLKRMIGDVLGLAGKVAGKLGSIPGLKGALHIGGSVAKSLIPGMATGGVVRSSGVSLIGENGPELLSFPKGARVDPLPALNGGSSRSTVPDVAGSLSQHTKLDVTVKVPVNIDGRKVADAVGRVVTDRANRR